jgi:hypothetical protein
MLLAYWRKLLVNREQSRERWHRPYPLLAGTESPGDYSPNHAHHPKWACKHLLAVSIMHARRHSGVKERRISRAGDSFTNAGKPGQRRMRLLRSVQADGCDRRCGAGFGQDAELCERCADNLGALRAGEGSVAAGIQPRIQKRRPVCLRWREARPAGSAGDGCRRSCPRLPGLRRRRAVPRGPGRLEPWRRERKEKK